jgi:hypothetical protein
VPGIGQVETDEIYIGINRNGEHFILTVQAKTGKDKIGIVQIEQDFAVCETKYPDLICKPIATQLIEDDLIAMFEFEKAADGIRVVSEKHYRLVHPDELTVEELKSYRERLEA